uniref:Uncharacterized protein LOC111131157 n=1 Tax=Crassostrea virginica TaxID=6565 RepID=A0A8B8E222_CRAVI|nr:uncharacterized protein LOC111131157 [Crassostrea virginica]XP_022334266.1 uncharacterized protein LOC111131157 [Crassostrea virginica]
MTSERQMRQEPAYRCLQKLRGLVGKENVSAGIIAEVDKAMDLLKARNDFCEQQTTRPSQDLQQLMKSTLQHDWQKAHDQGQLDHIPSTLMMSGNLEVQFFRTLASLGNVKRVLELGLFTGCSALALAESLPEDGKVISCEIDPYIANLARSFLDKATSGKKVEILNAPAQESMERLAQKKQQFDLIFLDADKPSYVQYYKMIFELGLLAPKGTILVDNALFFGDPYTKERFMGEIGDGVTQFNEVVKDDNTVHKVMLPIRDGIMMIRRKEDVD